MTANQLKYWELRWKQHYEKILAEVKVAEVRETIRHNLAVEEETKRHNKREERIDTQNMIINRGNLEARWAELNEKQRAAIVAEGLKRDEYNLAVQQELRQVRYTDAQINKMMSDMKLAQMDLAIDIVKAKHEVAANYIKAEAALLKNGWAKATAGEIIADVKSLMSSEEFDKYMKSLTSDATFSWVGETFGPAAISEIGKIANTDNQSKQEWQGPLTEEQMSQAKNKTKYENRPDFQPILKDSNVGVKDSDMVHGFSGTNSDVNLGVVETGKSGSRFYSNHKEAGSTKSPIETKHNNTGVIYSGGSHFGPGYV